MFLLAFHNPLPHRAPLHFPLFLLWGIKVRELVLVDNHRHQDRKDDSKDTPTVSWGVIFDPRPTSGTDNSHFFRFSPVSLVVVKAGPGVREPPLTQPPTQTSKHLAQQPKT